MALRPLIEVINEVHTQSKSDGSKAEMASKLVDAVGLISQGIYKINVLRVSIAKLYDVYLYIYIYVYVYNVIIYYMRSQWTGFPNITCV